MQVMEILKKNGKIDGSVRRVLEKFKDWEVYSFSIEYSNSEDYTIALDLGKIVSYPQGNRMEYKPLFSKIRFEAYQGNITVNYYVYHFEGFKKITLEEREITDNCNDAITLFLLKVIQKYINRNIKYIKSRSTQ